MYITLVGSKASSGKVPIVDTRFMIKIPAIYKNCYDDLMIESSADLGELLVVIIGNPKNPLFTLNPFQVAANLTSAVTGSAWFVSFVNFIDLQTKQAVEFPCYHWINDGSDVSFTARTSKRTCIVWDLKMYNRFSTKHL